MRSVVWLLLGIGLGACAGVELDAINPDGVDLSGTWLLDFSESDTTPNFRSGLGGRARVARRGNDEIAKQRTEILGAAGSGFAFIVHDYQVLSADKLKIEQNHDSMGIAHEPGVYRDVSWGERQRGLWEVYAGWEDRHLLIISKAPDMSVTERYMVKGNRLEVELKIQADDAERVLRRVYNRRSLSAR